MKTSSGVSDTQAANAASFRLARRDAYAHFLPLSVTRSNSRSPMIAVDGMLNKSVTAQFVASCPQGVAGPGRVKVTITTSVMGRKQTTKELNSEDMIGLAKSIRKHMKQTEKDTPDYKNYKAFLQLVKFASMPLE